MGERNELSCISVHWQIFLYCMGEGLQELIIKNSMVIH